ncbi:T9SS sorting signal type C domain-containing protein [uncultured Flavobacterium sp.]|uniref:T9SS sorting signal type C domain-containing protein n=1 Tax=uncultured Flavobacterium sp. TaxID=165435 RepID=UPI003081B264
MIRKLLYFVRSLFYFTQNNCDIVFFDRKKVSSSGMQFSHLLFVGLFTFLSVNFVGAQAASSTWALTSIPAANPTVAGNISATAITWGTGINTPAYSAGAGISTSGWIQSSTRVLDEYYEFKVTPTAGNIFNVSAINFEHSRSSTNLNVQVYYSTDDFVTTSTAVSGAFTSSSSTPAANNNAVTIPLDGTTLTVRIYAWSNSSTARNLRIRNFVISGTTCGKAGAAGTISGSGTVCQGQNSVAYSVPAITNATGYTWTLPTGATIATGNNTNSITVNYSSTATSGNVTVKGTNSCGSGSGTVSSNFPVTVNQLPTTSNAGPDQYKNTPFTLAANTPTVGTGVWSIASGPNLSTGQFSDVSNPTATFTPSGAGTWALNWTISNGCGTSTDQVLISNCSGNLITNGDFSNGATGWTPAINSKGSASSTSYVEVLSESVYFSNSNNDNTAELDKEASLGQTVTVIPNVQYTLSFLYARRPGSPATVAVDVRVYEGGSITATRNITTTDTNNTPQVGTLTFTPTSSSIVLEFYNSLGGTSTLGSIVDNIVLIPATQVVPIAVTNPKGSYKTLTACSGAPVQLDVDNISASGVTYVWSGSAAATFSSTTIKNPTVTFSSSGVIEQVTVVATTAGGCSGTPSSTFVNVTALPTVNPGGALAAICQGATSAAMGGSVGGGATSGTWSGGAGTWTNATNASTATYKAGASESGSITLTLTTVGATCVATATKTITVNPNPTANAGSALTAICQGATSAAMGGSIGGGATSGVWTGGAGSWANANNPSTATYTAGASESGSITLTLTTSGGSCGSTTATKTITVNPNPTANAGGALTAICQGATSAAMGGSIGGSATTGIWTGGAGSWTNANNPSTATYTASTSESGSITLTLTTSGGSCGPKTATKTITVNPNPTANAGSALTAICQGATSAAMGGSIGGGATSGIWTGGAGSWTNANNPSTAAYTAGASESGSITLTLTTSGGSCGSTTATKTITVNTNPTANAGGALTAICQGATSAAMGGSIGGSATSGIWTGGAGSWTNANNPSTATYTAGASESGSITLTLTTSGGSCGPKTATKTITVNPNPTANAGSALTAICQGATSSAMGGSVGGGATSGIWTGGAGSWTNANNPSTATYTASASESGSITLTLTTSGGSCASTTATKTITVNPNPTANAGGALTAICQGATSAAMGGSVGGGATSGTWSGGAGSWTNANNPSTATYTAGASESGSITLTLTTSGGSCGSTTATKTITVNPNPTANAGGALTAICQGATSAAMGGSVGGGATSGTWSGGAGTWTNATNASTATYKAGASESGSITLTLTTSGGSCGSTTATKTITVNPNPTANAGSALTAICQGATSAAMGGSIGGGATSGIWTGGAGSWTNANNPSTATYTAGASESGSITLTLTTSGGSCGSTTATKTITVNTNPTANAGGALTAICQGATSAAMGGSIGGSATSGIWTGGAGSWTNANNPSTATYTASASESGSITLTLTTSGGSCGPKTATKTITVNPNPTANAGSALTAICQGATSATMGGSVGGGATSGVWTGGAGSWTNANNPSTATYTAGASESGSITLTLTTSGGSCGSTTATKTITVNPNPTANAGGALTAICQGATSAAMGGSVGGGATSGVWTGGAGSWTNANNPSTATYTAGASESGSITLTLTTSGGSCGSTTATKTITVNPNPTASAGGALTAICQGATSAAMGGSIGGGATSGTWTGGAGTWTNANNPSTATYTASASESGSITLTLTTSGGSCGPKTATKTITVNPNPKANAGGALTAICQGAISSAMGGSIGGGATSGVWTGGAGSWTNANNPSTATYTAGASESGSITLTLTTSGGSCGSITVTKTITVNPNLSAVAITPNGGQALCLVGTGTTLTVSETGGTTITSRQWGKRSVSGGTITNISGQNAQTFTPTGANLGVGDWLIVCTSTPSCGSAIVSNEVSVKVSPDIVASVTISASPSGTICSGTLVTFTATPVNEGTAPTYQWYNGLTPVGTGLSTYSSSTLANADDIKVIMTSNASPCLTGSPATSNTITMSVNTLPGTPSPGTPTQPTCASPTGGSVLLSNLPSSGTWTITQSGSAPNTYNGTGSTYNVQNLAAGNYTFTVVGAANSCSSLASTNVAINAAVSKVWTGNADGNWSNPANWNPAVLPSASDCIVIPDVASLPNAPSVQGTGVVANAYTITVNDNASLIVNSKNTLRVVASVTVAPLGSLVFLDQSSLVQTTNATNTGNIIYNRNTDLVRRYDFTYWATPITNPAQPYKLSDLSPNTLLDKYNSYDSPTSSWDISLNGTRVMVPAIGYTVRAPQSFSLTIPAIYPAVFTGIPNNGDYSAPLYAAKWSLIGNPYPSAIDAEEFININHFASPSVDVGALYFWTHNSPPSSTPSAGGSYDYTSNDYAVFTLSGSTRTGAKRPDGTYDPAPTGQIAACQSFFMKASAPGIVKFTNDMRIDGGNDQFYKTTKSKAIEKNRLWLNLTSNQGAFKQILVGYIEGATNEWDVNYDATANNGNTFVDFYSINEATKLSIQGRALPFTDTDRIPLGYKTTVAGDFVISIDHADGFFNNQLVYLEDRTTGKITDLKAGDYTFTTAIGTFADRFTISYIKKTLGTGDFENLENSVFVSVKDKAIKVTSTKETIKEVTIYDINGQLLYNKKKVDTAELQISSLQSSNQVLLVKVTLDNDFTTTKKIIFQ